MFWASLAWSMTARLRHGSGTAQFGMFPRYKSNESTWICIKIHRGNSPPFTSSIYSGPNPLQMCTRKSQFLCRLLMFMHIIQMNRSRTWGWEMGHNSRRFFFLISVIIAFGVFYFVPFPIISFTCASGTQSIYTR